MNFEMRDNLVEYGFEYLGIEITRKCNYNCVHCLKGDAQDLTITPEIIETVFSQIDYCSEIFLFGGEPLLAIDMIEYIINSAEHHNLNLKNIAFVTNGSILNRKVIDILNDFCDKWHGRNVSFVISDDKYHDVEQSMRCYEFYTQLAHDNSQIVISFMSDENSNVNKNGILKRITITGRGKDYFEKNKDELLKQGVIPVPYSENDIRQHQICIYNNIIQCKMLLTAKGQLRLLSSCSYTEEDTDGLGIGNVMQEPLYDIISNHNNNCPFCCDECFNEVLTEGMCKNQYASDCYKDYSFATEQEKYNREYFYFFYQLNSERWFQAWKLRILAKEIFPHLPMREIIAKTPVPTQQVFTTWLDNLIAIKIGTNRACNLYYKKYKSDFPHQSDENLKKLSMLRCCLEYLIEHENQLIYPFKSQEKAFESNLFAELQLREEIFISHPETECVEIDVCENICDSLSDIHS